MGQDEARRARQANDFKEACLDLAAAAGTLFDLVDRSGLEAAIEGDEALLAVRKLGASYEIVGRVLQVQGLKRLQALGVSAETLRSLARKQ